ncbi:thiamine pyrophosphate-binding protein [Paenibacillus sp. FSL R7-0652]|uniref:Thiamine pyrophosphate-binding protein n=1 Tax=Paenibacillus sp. AN1007 TaxID=3151385 RepID=A0AAU8NEB1_9BACL
MNSTTVSTAAEKILSILQANGYNHFTGVPCSLLKGIFALLEQSDTAAVRYIPAVREDAAIGVASGFAIAGHKSVVLMQNSGLGYCLNVLTSFNMIYELPILLVISWRGAYGDDAVEHDIIGDRLTHLLEAVEIPYVELGKQDMEQTIAKAIEQLELTQKPAAILIKDEV